MIKADLYRNHNRATGYKALVYYILFGESFKYIFWMRVYFSVKRSFIRFPVAIVLTHYKYKLGINIPPETKIGPGLYIGHFGGIIVSPHAKNCNISHGVTIGQSNRGGNKGYPVIGNNTFIGPGAKIFGSVRIGNNVAIGANSVVTKDVPDNAVVTGNPAKIVSYDGSVGYVNMTDYR